MTTTLTEPTSAVQTDQMPSTWTLNATHRCDKCSAQAYVQVFFKSGNDLLFCNHHFKTHKDAMHDQGIISTVTDESSRLDTGNRHQGSEN